MAIKIRKLDSAGEGFAAELRAVLAFEASEDDAIERAVAQILADVKARGDAAVLDYTNRFDRLNAASVAALELPQSELEAALEGLEPTRRAAPPPAAPRGGGAAPAPFRPFATPARRRRANPNRRFLHGRFHRSFRR